MSLSSVRLGRALVVVAMAGVLAACTGEADATPEATDPEPTASPSASEAMATETATAAASADDSAEATILVADSDHGEILTDADGLTIYYFANDTEGVSNCEGECLVNWPPVEAGDAQIAGDGVDAELGTFERSDGTAQLTINGFPAYYFAGDAAAGDVNGQGQGDVWWVFGPDGEPIEE
jgi:predicted lipoprotein with Yx(FWY)xxD motif